jgi:hypothetical protein
MGFPTKVQLINRKASEQWYINFPSAIAQAMDFPKARPSNGSSRIKPFSRCVASRPRRRF